MDGVDVPDLTDVLSKCLQPDDRVRQEAENYLLGLLGSNLALSLCSLAAQIGTEEKDPATRRIAGTVFKNALSVAKKADPKEHPWFGIDQNLRENMKILLWKGLHSPQRFAADSACSVITNIALLELPLGLWPDLIQNLLDCMKAQNNKPDHVKIASVTTLGYICEEIDPDIIQDKSNMILTAVIEGMKCNGKTVNNDLVLGSVMAFGNCLEFIEQNFHNSQERDVIMSMMMTTCQLPDEQIQETAMMCLGRIAQNYYQFLGAYMHNLFDLTMGCITKSGNPSAGCQAIEFWSTIAEEEFELLLVGEGEEEDKEPEGYLGLTEKVLGPLLPVLLGCLTQRDEDEYEGDEWNIAMAASNCLTKISPIVGNAILPHVVDFIKTNIQHDDWQKREAAVLAFGNVMEGPDEEVMMEYILSIMKTLFDLLKGDNPYVKETTAWTLGRICEFHSATIMPHFNIFMEQIVPCLRDSWGVANNACFTIYHLANACYEAQTNPTSPLTKYYGNLVIALTEAVNHPGAAENTPILLTAIFEAMTQVIKCGAQDTIPLSVEMFPFFMDKMKHTLTIENKETRTQLQGLLCNVFMALTNKVGEEMAGFATPVLEMMLTLLQNVRAIEEDVLMVVGSISAEIGAEFKNFLDPFMPFVLRGLEAEELTMLVVTIGIVGDFCRSAKEKMNPYGDKCIDLFLNILKNPNVDEIVKPHVLSTFGDLATAMGLAFEQHLPVVCAVLQSAAKTPLPEDPDEEEIEHLNTIYSSVFDAYICLLQSLHETHRGEIFKEEAKFLVEFLIYIMEHDPNEDVSSRAVGVIGDLALLQIPEITMILKNPKIKWILDQALNSGDEELITTAKWAYKEVRTDMPGF